MVKQVPSFVTDKFLNTGRLEDKSPYVRKNALLLMSSLLSFNPFAPHLPEDKFVATLEEYKRKLQVPTLSFTSSSWDIKLFAFL